MNGYYRFAMAKEHYPQVHSIIVFFLFLWSASVLVRSHLSIFEVSFNLYMKA